MRFSAANTLSFYKLSDVDNSSVFSNPFNTPQNRDVPNTYSAKYYQPFIVGKAVKFQIINETQPIVHMVNTTTSTRVEITGVNVSPVGWAGIATWEFYYLFSESGTYYVRVSDGDNLLVKSNYICTTNNNKNVIDIVYSNSKNDYSMIFTQDNENFNTFNILCQGRWSTNTGNEVESLTDDEGNTITLDAVPVLNYYLELSPLSGYMETMLNNIFSCDFLMVNGVKCQLVESIEPEKMGESNMRQITATLRIDSEAGDMQSDKIVITDGATYIIDSYDVAVSN